MEQITADSIITLLQSLIKGRVPLAPDRFVNAGIMLTAFLGIENDKYAELYQKAHRIQYEVIQEGKTASEAEAKMKASQEYAELLRQKGKCEQIMEMIRLAKIRATLTDKEIPLSEV